MVLHLNQVTADFPGIPGHQVTAVIQVRQVIVAIVVTAEHLDTPDTRVLLVTLVDPAIAELVQVVTPVIQDTPVDLAIQVIPVNQVIVACPDIPVLLVILGTQEFLVIRDLGSQGILVIQVIVVLESAAILEYQVIRDTAVIPGPQVTQDTAVPQGTQVTLDIPDTADGVCR